MTDPDVQRRRDVRSVGCGERAAAAEFPRARGGCALSGPGALGDGQHVCFWGEKESRQLFIVLCFRNARVSLLGVFAGL